MENATDLSRSIRNERARNRFDTSSRRTYVACDFLLVLRRFLLMERRGGGGRLTLCAAPTVGAFFCIMFCFFFQVFDGSDV